MGSLTGLLPGKNLPAPEGMGFTGQLPIGQSALSNQQAATTSGHHPFNMVSKIIVIGYTKGC